MRILITLFFLLIQIPIFSQKPSESGKYILQIYHLDSIQSHPLILEQEEKDFALIYKIFGYFLEEQYFEITSPFDHPHAHIDDTDIAKFEKREKELKEFRLNKIEEINHFKSIYKERILAFFPIDSSFIESPQLLYYNPQKILIQDQTETLVSGFLKNIHSGPLKEDWDMEIRRLYWQFLKE